MVHHRTIWSSVPVLALEGLSSIIIGLIVYVCIMHKAYCDWNLIMVGDLEYR